MRRYGSEGQVSALENNVLLGTKYYFCNITINNRVRCWNVYESVGRYNALDNEYRVKGVNADAKFLRIQIPVSATL